MFFFIILECYAVFFLFMLFQQTTKGASLNGHCLLTVCFKSVSLNLVDLFIVGDSGEDQGDSCGDSRSAMLYIVYTQSRRRNQQSGSGLWHGRSIPHEETDHQRAVKQLLSQAPRNSTTRILSVLPRKYD